MAEIYTTTHCHIHMDTHAMPVWTSDDEIDCQWISSKILSEVDEHTEVTKAQVVDISNEGRKGATRPRDGATLLLTVTLTAAVALDQSQKMTRQEKTYVIKQVADSGLPLSRQLGLAREAFFFNDLAPKVKINKSLSSSSPSAPSTTISTTDYLKIIPKVYYAYGDMDAGTKIVIMEDLSKGYIDSGILFGNGNPNNWKRNLPEMIEQAYGGGGRSSSPSPSAALHVPTSYEVANETFLSIAKVHATFWNDESLLLLPDSVPQQKLQGTNAPSIVTTSFLRGAMWLQGKDEGSWKASQGLIQGMWQKVNSSNDNGTSDDDDKAGNYGSITVDQRIKWDPLVKQTVEKAIKGISWEAQVQRLNANTNWTLVHGDFWPGNIMISTADVKRLRLLDWEMCGLGSGPQDLGQYILSNMDPQERRNCEQKLIRNYYDELIKLGIDASKFSWEECWKEYTIGGIERWVWFLVYFVANDNMLDWAQFFHDQIAAFMHDHNITPEDVTQPRP